MNIWKPRLGIPNNSVKAALRWHFSPTGNAFLNPDCLDIEEHLRQGRARVVKHGLNRTVYHVRLPQFNIFWKHCRISGLRSLLREATRQPKARMEFDAAQALAARGIPTIEPLAWAEEGWRFAGPSHLITRELTDAIPLQTYLVDRCMGNASVRHRHEAAVALGRCLGQIHEAGVEHPDLHPGNILVVVNGDGQPRFHLLDVHNVLFGPPLPRDESLANLVLINHWFFLRVERSDRLRFWKSYCETRRWAPAFFIPDAREIEKRTLPSIRQLWEGRDERCLRATRDYRPVRSDTASGFVVSQMDEKTLERFLADPDFPFRDPECKRLKDSRTSTVAEIVVPTPDGPRTMIYKRFRLKKHFASLANRFRQSPALRSWQMGHALRDRDLPTPLPWLVLHRRGLTGPREGYLLCEKVESARELGNLDVAGNWGLIAELGRLLRRFHDAGLCHRDLKAANILCTLDSAEGDRFHFIDLVGVGRSRTMSDADCARDLSRLNVSFLQNPHVTRTDRLHFLRAYLRWSLRGRGDWKIWWKRIGGATLKKIDRNRRTGRPLA